jgi:2,4-dienoyl-CoA reductase-like NADH-dependent reductase (Old Yellow Enzyme family)
MARTKNFILNGMSGAVGKLFVVKQYAYGSVITAYPDMSKVKPSKKQKLARNRFADAVQYAQEVLADPELTAKYKEKLKKGRSVYHKVVGQYMKKGR